MTARFGIVGCGMIAKFHAKAIRDIRGAKLIACHDHAPANADRFGREYACQPCHSLSELVYHPDIDIITICTPSGAHLEPAVAAAKAGKHVIVEKPLEITLRRCDRIIAACEQHQVVLSTIFPSRFQPAAQFLKKAMDAGRFGRLTLADAYVKWYRTQQYYDSGAWRGTWQFDGGGALMNQAIHCVDLLTWLMGPVEQITAQTATLAHERIAVEDVATASLRFANGALGVIEATTAAFPGFGKRIEIHGSEGSAVMEEEEIRTWTFARPRATDAAALQRINRPARAAGGAGDPAAIGHQGHVAQFKDVLQAIRSGKRPLIDGHEGRRSVEIILAIYKAAENGKIVRLPLAGDPTLTARRRNGS